MIRKTSKILKKNIKEKSGQTALFVVFVTTSLLLFVGLFLTSVTLKQMRVVRSTLDSIQAYYLADTGAERILYQVRAPHGVPKIDLNNYAAPIVVLDKSVPGLGSFKVEKVNNSPLRVKVFGVYRESSRAVELSWE